MDLALVIVDATADGNKELVAFSDGFRESTESWLELLRDIKARGLKTTPRLGIGDGSMGFWSALEKEFPNTKHQRCWVHKTANITNKLPKSPTGKAMGYMLNRWQEGLFCTLRAAN